MKLATVLYRDQQLLASVDDAAGVVRFLSDDLSALGMLGLIRRWGELSGQLAHSGTEAALSDVVFLAPLPQPPRNIMCVGKNYHAHAQEFTRSGFDSSASSVADAIPQAPIIFTKAPETVIGHDAEVRIPHGLSSAIDYEAELGVIIGKGGRGITAENALDHVWGYTIINDVTARDMQSKHKQWFLGKSLDTFCPMGPVAVTADAIRLDDTGLRCRVNGELRQDANTRDLIFDVPTLIATISAGLTLVPGDVIATGTPAGVGIGFTPPRYLATGDVVEIEIDGIGRLSNRFN